MSVPSHRQVGALGKTMRAIKHGEKGGQLAAQKSNSENIKLTYLGIFYFILLNP